ncbi:hypothetical protein [Dyadobacter sp. CY343]|uniref:hypothetical protein n=1 Tax=Dyadobacter sp. CY343 TaxID=2907299 RepID=UPI001F22FDEC|nr:hypothetical protein [Dyadobacter sp. CY343]MCE7059718.1 hypothetical protein [Dyadobacter sp. CY343]
MRRVAVLVILYLCWITFKNYKKLDSEHAATELDTMNVLLAGVENYISPHSNIAFQTNTPAGRHGVLYFKSALILAPAVLQLESNADTILLLEEHQLPEIPKEQYETISAGDNQHLKYTLMRLKR